MTRYLRLRMPDDLFAEVTRRATAEGTTPSEIVRRALRQTFAEPAPEPSGLWDER